MEASEVGQGGGVRAPDSGVRVGVGTAVPCLWLLVAILLGMTLDRWLALPTRSVAIVALVAWLLASARIARVRPGASAALLVVASAWGAQWHHRAWSIVSARDIRQWLPGEGRENLIQVKGWVASEVTRDRPVADAGRGLGGDTGFRWALQVERVRSGAAWELAAGRLLVYGRGTPPAVAPGAEVWVSGRLSDFAPPENPGQRDGRGEARLAGWAGVLHLPHAACVRPTGNVAGWLGGAARLRIRWSACLIQHLGVDAGGLAAALLLGRRDLLNSHDADGFRMTGLAHVLAISGMHVSILTGFGMLAVRAGWLPRRTGLAAIIVMLAAYAWLVDANAPVLRAVVLLQMVCLSWWTRRRTVFENNLALGGLMVIGCAPLDLFRTGTQLSFLAVATISCASHAWKSTPPSDPLEQLIQRTRPWMVRTGCTLGRHTVRLLATGLAVWAVTTPLLMWRFNLVTPAAIVMSVLVWLPLAGALLGGFLLVIVDEIGGWGREPVAWICHQCLHGLRAIVRAALVLPLGTRWTATPDWSAMAGGYLLCGIAWLSRVLRSSRAWTRNILYAAMICFLFASLLPWLRRRLRGAALQATFLALGHGVCVVLQLPDGQVWLYDAGRMGNVRSGVDIVSRYLWSEGITRVDRVFLSHVDADHYNLLPELIRRFRPRSVHVPGACDSSAQATLRRLQRVATAHGAHCFALRAPATWRDGGCLCRVLFPDPFVMARNDNGLSLVLRIDHAGHRLLLTGDIEADGVAALSNLGRCPVDVAMAPHHGSELSTPRSFVDWCLPRWLVISGGRRDGQAIRALSANRIGTTVLHTAYDGAVTVKMNAQGIQVEPFRAGGKPS